MKKLLAGAKHVVAFLICLSMIPSFVGCKKENNTEKEVPEQAVMYVENAEEAIDQLANIAEDLGYENALSELSEKSTATIDGDSYYRLQQNYQGIPVYGKTVVCVTDENGEVLALTGNVIDIGADISLKPTATKAVISEAIEEYLGVTMEGTSVGSYDAPTNDSLCIYSMDESGEELLAYRINVGACELLVDAHNAEVIQCTCTVFEDTTSSVGYTDSDKEKKYGFPVEISGDATYIMRDVSRGLTVYTFDGNISYDGNDFFQDRSMLLESSDSIFGNTQAEHNLEYETGAKLLQNTIKIYDYFTALGHTPVMSTIKLYYNDGWDDGENALGGTDEGCGVISMGSLTGVNRIDVIAHEYTHFVSREIVDWLGQGENGAINEALSDIFGVIIEAEVAGKKIDWVVELYDGGVRNLSVPSLSTTKDAGPQPSKYKGTHWADTNNSYDDGGVHINSTVISHAAYLMSKSSGGALSNEELAKLWYRAMLMMPSDCDFAECRTLVELAAKSMSFTDEQLLCVSKAFDTVGISDGTVVDYEINTDTTLSVYGIDSKLCDNYTITIEGRQLDVDNIENLDAQAVGFPINIQYLYLMLSKEYSSQIDVSTAGPIKVDLPIGSYSVTLCDKADSSKIYTFRISVGAAGGKDKLDIYTDFGTTSQSKQLTAVKTYDGNGQLTEMTEYEYDEYGKLISIVRIEYGEYGYRRVECEISYDDKGRISAVDGLKFFYNEEGKLVSCSTKYDGKISFDYDSLGRCIRKTEVYYGESTVTEYYYGEGNQLVRATKSYTEIDTTYTENYTYSYDSQNRLIKVSSSGGFGGNTSETFDYSYPSLILRQSNWNHDGSFSTRFLIPSALVVEEFMDIDSSTIDFFNGCKISLADSQFICDSDGYLSKIVCDGNTYELFYGSDETH